MSLPGLPLPGRKYESFFETAAATHGVGAYLIAAVCSRETDFRNIVGDHGFGFGLMQIDIRSFPEFCRSPDALDPWRNIEFGTGILAKNIHALNDEFMGVAAYNRGLPEILHVWHRIPPGTSEADARHVIDSYTTGRNYATDVLARRDSFVAAERAVQPVA